MANEEQLAIFERGTQVWNDWRAKNKLVDVDLSEFDFSGWDRSGADLYQADLHASSFQNASLGGADLAGANLQRVDLREINLIVANLSGTLLDAADLSEADLSEADLRGATLQMAKLNQASLVRADLSEANLAGSNFSKVRTGGTVFGNLDLSQVIGLASVIHEGPSTIGSNTFAKSKGKISEVFLRGCGLSDWEIEQVKLYNPDLSNDEFIDIQNRIFDLRQRQAIQISPLFISYSHADSTFVDKVGNKFTEKGVRFWRDTHDMKSGKLEKQIDQAIRQNPTVLLVLSEHSLSSDWVEHEVRTARQLEKDIDRDVLCPVALDDSWKTSPWPARVMEQIMEYNILDFSEWQDDVKFDGMFHKLIDGLQLFYKR